MPKLPADLPQTYEAVPGDEADTQRAPDVQPDAGARGNADYTEANG
jgi:hypothetical protein